MKIISVPVIVLIMLGMTGCSMPTRAVQGSLYSIFREEKVRKGFMGSSKSVKIKDFRQNEAYAEEMEELKQKVEEYILRNPALSEDTKNNLRELKVTRGTTSEEAALLLGKPDKRMKASGRGRYGATEIWIYRISKIRVFTVFIVPAFPVHEGYYLYFKDGALVEIERHYLQQSVEQSAGPGIIQSK